MTSDTILTFCFSLFRFFAILNHGSQVNKLHFNRTCLAAHYRASSSTFSHFNFGEIPFKKSRRWKNDFTSCQNRPERLHMQDERIQAEDTTQRVYPSLHHQQHVLWTVSVLLHPQAKKGFQVVFLLHTCREENSESYVEVSGSTTSQEDQEDEDYYSM